MQTKPKSNSVITHALQQRADGTALLTFIVKDVGNVVLDTAKCHAAVRAKAETHGWFQRINDAAAISRNTETGKPASPKDKFDALRALVEHYHSGTSDWSRKSERLPGRDSSALLIEAMCEVYPEKDRATVEKFVEGKSAKERVALLNHGEIKKAADAIRAKAVETIDAEGLLKGL